MKRIVNLVAASAIVLSLLSAASAQNEIPAEKRKLIEEVLELTETRSQINEITDTMLAGMEAIYPSIVDSMLARQSDLTESEKAAAKAWIEANHKIFSTKFRQRLPNAIDYDSYIRDSIHPIYDRNFTEKELSDLIAFYKTETGRKVVRTMPRLYAESMEAATRDLTPKIIVLAEEILEETFDIYLDDPPPPPPKPKKG